jgi:undecaprenyl diphosphate synthase
VDYSARFSIVQTARIVRAQGADALTQAAGPACHTDAAHDFLRLMDEVNHSGECGCDVDLLIRTGGEKRLSDFMLWECAYAELYFTDCAWPDFDEGALQQALREFAGRQRRFGRLAGEPSRA